MEKIRKFAETRIAKVFLALIFMSFMSWGITGYVMGSSAKKTALTIADVEISLQSLSQKVKRQKLQLQKIMGKSIPSTMLDERMLVDQIIKNTTETILFNIATRDLGLYATNEFTLEQIRSMQEFQKDGKFSADAFHKILAYNGMSEQGFLSEISQQHTRYLLRSGLESIKAIPDFFVKNKLKLQKQNRTILMKEFNASEVKNIPSEADLITIYEQNKHRFIQSEYRQISVLFIKKSHVKGEKNKENLLKLAQDIENEIIGGAGFEEVAKQFAVETIRLPLLSSQIKQQDGTKFASAEVSNELISEAFKVDEGLETALLKGKDGFVLLRPEKIIEATPRPFEEVRGIVKKIWASKEKEKINYLNANAELTKAKESKSFNGNKINISRDGMANPDLIAKVFMSKIGDLFIVKTGEQSILVKLEKIENPKISTATENYKTAKKIAMTEISNFIYDDYLKFLEQKYGVEKEDERIEKFFAPKE